MRRLISAAVVTSAAMLIAAPASQRRRLRSACPRRVSLRAARCTSPDRFRSRGALLQRRPLRQTRSCSLPTASARPRSVTLTGTSLSTTRCQHRPPQEATTLGSLRRRKRRSRASLTVTAVPRAAPHRGRRNRPGLGLLDCLRRKLPAPGGNRGHPASAAGATSPVDQVLGVSILRHRGRSRPVLPLDLLVVGLVVAGIIGLAFGRQEGAPRVRVSGTLPEQGSPMPQAVRAHIHDDSRPVKAPSRLAIPSIGVRTNVIRLGLNPDPDTPRSDRLLGCGLVCARAEAGGDGSRRHRRSRGLQGWAWRLLPIGRGRPRRSSKGGLAESRRAPVPGLRGPTNTRRLRSPRPMVPGERRSRSCA